MPEGCPVRGVVFQFHGYGNSIQREAKIAALLSKHGHFEVYGVDQRGFGESGGQRDVIESAEDVLSDQWLMINEAIKKYKID